MENRKIIKCFQDLEVYQRLYQAMLTTMREIIPRLPKEERFDLTDQLRRSCKAPPALLAEGFAKRYQIRQWRKYLDDAIGECNETINHLSVCNDLYGNCINISACTNLINDYNIANKQLFRLRETWQDFHHKE